MRLEGLVSKYITCAENVFGEMKIAETCTKVDIDSVKKIVEFAKAYLDDAKYYKSKNRFEVSLASVVYCEGLLDALKLLGAVKFEWPVKKKKERRR